MTETSKFSIENEDLSKFPKSFYFFNDILKYDALFSWLTYVCLGFAIFQLFCVSFFPIYFIENQNAGLCTKIIIAIISFKNNEEAEDQFESKFLDFMIFSLLLLIDSFPLIMMYFFCLGKQNNKTLSTLRGLLILHIPSIFLIPLNLVTAADILPYIKDRSFSTITLSNFMYKFIIILFLYAFTYWSAPLITNSPLFSGYNYPSRIIPDNFFLSFFYRYIFSLFFTYFIKSDYVAYFYEVFSAIISIDSLIQILSSPFYQVTFSSAIMSISISFIINPILVILYKHGFFSDTLMFLLGIVFFSISFIIGIIYFIHSDNKIFEQISQNRIPKFTSYNMISNYVQAAEKNNCFTEELTNSIHEASHRLPDPQITLLYFYCQLKTCSPNNLNTLSRSAASITYMKSLSYIQRFAAFRLSQQFTEKITFTTEINGLSQVIAIYDSYKAYVNQFWSHNIAGDIQEAFFNLDKALEERTKLEYKLACLMSFYPNYTKFLELSKEFGQSHESKNDVDAPSQNQSASFSNLNSSSRINLNSTLTNTVTGATTSTSIDLNPRLSNHITNNMRKYLNQDSNSIFLIFDILFLFIAFIYLCFSANYSFSNLFRLDSYIKISSIIKDNLNIYLSWPNLHIVLAHISNCTSFIGESHEAILHKLNSEKENPAITIINVDDLYLNISNYISNVTALIYSASNIYQQLTKTPELDALISSWDNHVIYPFSLINSSNLIPQLKNLPIPLRSLLIKFFTEISLAYDPSAIESCPSSGMHEYISTKSFPYSKVSNEIMIAMADSIQESYNYVISVFQKFGVNSVKSSFTHYVVFGLFAIIIFFIILISKNYYIYKLLIKYFRPAHHPVPEYEVTSSKEPSSFRPYKKIINATFIVILVFLIIDICSLVIHSYSKANFEEMMNSCLALSATLNSSIRTGLLISHFIYRFQFVQDNNHSFSKILDGFNQHYHPDFPLKLQSVKPQKYHALNNETFDIDMELNVIRTNLSESFKVLNKFISKIKNNERHSSSSSFFLDNCTSYSFPSSLHDSYKCWSLIRQIYFLFYISHAFDEAGSISIESTEYHQIQHLWFTHLQNGFISLSSQLANCADNNHDTMLFLGKLDISFLVIAILLTLFFSSYCYFIYKRFIMELNSIFLSLSPLFIASEPCLMDYIIPSKIDTNDNKTTDSLFNVFDKAGLSIVIINDRSSIVAFTSEVQTLFEYRAEQLLGQSIELIIPIETKSMNRNKISFYKKLNAMKKRNADVSFIQDVIGRSSDGSDIQMQVSVFMVDVVMKNKEIKDFFVIDIKSVSLLYYYDEYIQKHKDTFSDLFATTFPVSLFPEISADSPSISTHFDKFAVVYVVHQKKTFTEFSNQQNGDEIIASVEPILRMFSGEHGAIMLNVTSTHALALFVDLKDGQLFWNAWEFYQTFSSGDNSSPKCGFIVSGTDLDLLLFLPPPALENDYTLQQLIEASNSRVPWITIEPFAKIMHDLPVLMNAIKPGTVLMSEDVKNCFDGLESPQVLIPELKYSLYLLDSQV